MDGMELESLFSIYDGGGASSYSPVMLLKALVYAYTQKVYSSRRIAKQIREILADVEAAVAKENEKLRAREVPRTGRVIRRLTTMRPLWK
jgi:transposase